MTVTFDLKRYGGGGGRHGAKRENYNSRKSVILYRAGQNMARKSRQRQI